MSERPPTCLLRTPAPDSSAVLFCIPYLGTGASLYRAWPHRFDGVEVCPVQLPGRENRIAERSPPSYGDLAADLATALAPHARPRLGLFGHCASAFIALEVGMALAAAGRPPDAVFVSSMVAPHESQHVPILDLSSDEVPAYVRELLAARGVEVPDDVMGLTVEIMRCDLEMYRRYQRDVTDLGFPVVAVGWSDDREVPPERLRSWSTYGSPEPVVLAGGHWTFVDAPPALLSVMGGVLRPADGQDASRTMARP